MSLKAPTPQVLPPPAAPAPPPVFGENPTGTKPQAKSSQTTFLGANTVANNPGSIGKTLLGQ